jgi:general secretion pathway protein C
MKRLPLLSSFLLFLMLCASITYWLLQWMAPATRPLVVQAQVERALPPMSAAANLFGGTSEVVSAIPVQLKGIIRAARPSDSVAIIGLEGKPARALRVNAEVANGIVIKEINVRGVVLADHGVEREVRLPQFFSKSVPDGANPAVRNAVPLEQNPPAVNDGQKDGRAQ